MPLKGRPTKKTNSGGIAVTNVFMENKETKVPVVVNRGGARSSKSYSIIQLLTERFFSFPGRQVLMLRKTLPSLRKSTYRDFKTYLDKLGLESRVKESKMEMCFTYGKSLVQFGCLDDPTKIKCFHPDTEILSSTGWKNIKEIVVGELVASLNPETFEMEYKPVATVYEYDYEGKMVTLHPEDRKKTQVDFCVTPNHKMFTKSRSDMKYHFVEADKLSKEYYCLRSAKYNGGNDLEYFEVPKLDYSDDVGFGRVVYSQPNRWKENKNGRKELKFKIENWLEFFGWYISEGNCDGQSVVLTQSKPDGVKKLTIVMTNMFEDNFSHNKKTHRFYFHSKDMVSYLKQFGLSDQKFIPRWVLDLKPELLRYLFNGLIDGDGCIAKSGKRWSYGTTSYQLANDVSEIAIKLGFAATVKPMDMTKYYPTAKPFWLVYIVDRTHTKKQEGTYFIDYKGKVNCIEVPPYHLVLSRLNGKPIWIGQSTEWNDIFMEEGTEFTYEDFIILRTRMSAPMHRPAHGKGWIPNQLFIAFNPEDENHWLKEKLIEKYNSEDLKEIVSNYKDNPFLSEDYIKVLTDLEKDNPNYYRIYGLGEWGKLDHVIYSNWSVIDRFPLNCEEIIYGLDFGFNNPSALVKIGIKDNELFEEEKIYQTGLTNTDLIVAMNEVIPAEHKRNSFVFCDSAEPDRISEISDAGYNVVPADKSVKDGIDMVKRFKTYIVRGSDNLLKEKRSYSWKVDRKTEKILDDPIKFNNHAVDAERYAVHTFFKEYGVGPMVRFL